MYHECSRKVQGDFRRIFRLLTFEVLPLPMVIFLMCGLSIGLVDVLSGASGGNLTLQFVDSTVGPLAHVQIQLLTLVGCFFLLSFFPCRDWIGTSKDHLNIKLFANLCESASLWLLTVLRVLIPTQSDSISTYWVAYWNRTVVRQAPFLSGDHPQLE